MYSEALKKYGVTWNAKTLDAFLVNPMEKVPGTVMPMLLSDPRTRADVIGYLATVKKLWGLEPPARGSYFAALPGKAHCREALATPVTPQLPSTIGATTASPARAMTSSATESTAKEHRILPARPEPHRRA